MACLTSSTASAACSTPGKSLLAFEARAKTLLRAALREGHAVGHVHPRKNGHAAAARKRKEQPWPLR